MLLRFEFENAFCFLDENVLSMIPNADKRHPEHISKASKSWASPALRAAGVYGANGHGKTKLVDALLVLKMLVCPHPDMAWEQVFTPFRLSQKAVKAPSRFVVNFRTARAQYEYGVVLRDKKIDQEWLFEKSTRQEVMLFTRERSENRGSEDLYKFEFGARLRNSKSPSSRFKTDAYLQFLSAGLDDRTSFLSEAAEKRVQHLEDCFTWFANTLQIIKADAPYTGLHIEAAKNEQFMQFLSDSVAKSDTGIDALKLKRIRASEHAGKFAVPNFEDILGEAEQLEARQSLILATDDGPIAVLRKEDDDVLLERFVAVHQGEEGEVEFDISEESSGTRRLLDLYPMMFNLVEGDRTYVVDELDRKLHPVLAYEFLKSYLSQKRGQLIFTTHTTYLLDLDLLRRDEIWLVQKNIDGNSRLYSLDEFQIRTDLDVRRGYLHGRFGAIPDLSGLQESLER